MTEVLAIGPGAFVTQEDDGSRLVYNAVPGFDPVRCPADAPPTCSDIGPVLPIAPSVLATISLEKAQQVALAALQEQVDSTALVVGQLGDAALSTLSQSGIERLSPTLAQFTLNPDLNVASSITQLGLGNAIQLAGLTTQIRSELEASTQQLLESGELSQINPDPGNPSYINMFQRYSMALNTQQQYAPLVDAYRKEAMGLLDELGVTGFATFPPALPEFNYLRPISEVETAGGGIYGSGTTPISTTGGGFLDVLGSVAETAINNLPTIVSSLSRAGIIRGSVGEAFGYVPPSPTGVGVTTSPGTVAAITPTLVQDPCAALDNLADYLLCRAEQGIRTMTTPAQGVSPMPTINPNTGLPMYSPAELAAASGICRSGVQPVVQAPTLFRNNPCGGVRPVSRVQVMGPNGAIYVFANLGRATRGSNEFRVMKRLAKDNGYSCHKGGMGGRRYRRRRPR